MTDSAEKLARRNVGAGEVIEIDYAVFFDKRQFAGSYELWLNENNGGSHH